MAARACPACHAEAFGEGRERSRTGHRLRFLISNFYFLLSSGHSSHACHAIAWWRRRVTSSKIEPQKRTDLLHANHLNHGWTRRNTNRVGKLNQESRRRGRRLARRAAAQLLNSSTTQLPVTRHFCSSHAFPLRRQSRAVSRAVAFPRRACRNGGRHAKGPISDRALEAPA